MPVIDGSQDYPGLSVVGQSVLLLAGGKPGGVVLSDSAVTQLSISDHAVTEIALEDLD